MPLITITTREDRYPAESAKNDSYKQKKTAAIGRRLPEAFINAAENLGLDDDTPIEAVQVDFVLYHPRVVNGADIWFVIKFTESCPSEEDRAVIRDHIRGIITLALSWQGLLGKVRVAVDIYWGSSSGFIDFGDVQKVW